jgi:DNA repair protein RadC
MGPLDHEVLLMVSLDARRSYICDEIVSAGGSHGLQGRYRPLVDRALRNGAACLLLVHNHPSGDPRPSPADIRFTRAVKALANALEIELLDHLVVATSAAFSIRLGSSI